MRRLLFAVMALPLVLAACSPQSAAPASSYPNQPVKIVVARGAGGSTDIIARMLQPYLQKYLGTSVAVENVTGGGGVTGTDSVYKAKPDGYTLLFSVSNTDIMYQVLQGTPYDYRKFVPVYNIGGGDSQVIAVNKASGIKTLQDFINAAKSKNLTVARLSGINVSAIGMALLEQQAGIPAANLTSVPYEDGKAQALALAGNHVDASLGNPSSMTTQLKDGSVTALVYFGKSHYDQLPDVKTFQEVYPGDGNYYELYQSVLAPPGTPSDVVQKLDAAFQKATSDPEYVAKTKPVFTLTPMNGQQLGQELDKFYKRAEELKPLLQNIGTK